MIEIELSLPFLVVDVGVDEPRERGFVARLYHFGPLRDLDRALFSFTLFPSITITASLTGSPPLPSIKRPTSITVGLSCAEQTGTTVNQATIASEMKSHMFSSRVSGSIDYKAGWMRRGGFYHGGPDSSNEKSSHEKSSLAFLRKSRTSPWCEAPTELALTEDRTLSDTPCAKRAGPLATKKLLSDHIFRTDDFPLQSNAGAREAARKVQMQRKPCRQDGTDWSDDK